ncbi:hypothetical protein Tco_0788819 [Tanacetum coccineum]
MRPIYSAKLKLLGPLALLSKPSISAIHFFNHLSFICDRLIKKWTPEDCQRVRLCSTVTLGADMARALSLDTGKAYKDVERLEKMGGEGMPILQVAEESCKKSKVPLSR